MTHYIQSSVNINEKGVSKSGTPVFLSPVKEFTAEDIYRRFQCSYPKFFKMDLLCKWAWLGAELLLNEEGEMRYEGLDKNKVAVVLMTGNGCLEVDKKYKQTTSDIPSPALFVYTLPNIMLGEICIRHGFKGEQLCMVSEAFDTEEMFFWVNDLLNNRGMEACICGWADATGTDKELKFFWVGKNPTMDVFSAAQMRSVQ